MVALRHYAEQRFTCAQCGRCCRRGWDIALTAGEVEGYRKAGAAAWYTETDTAAETETGTVDPFEPLSGHAGHFRIRKRADGACGFLSAENRCRIHEQLRGARKPLTCRLFPFRFHPIEGKAVVSASFCCPTVVASEGEPVSAQIRSPASGMGLGLRARLVRLLAHTHGVGPAVGDVDLRAGRLVSRGFEDPAVHGLVHHYLRATVEDLGTGRRPVVDELVMAVALLDAALAFAAMRAGQAGRTAIDSAALSEGLLETMDLAHAEPAGAYARVLVSLAAGLDALWMFGESTEKIDRHG